jgi:hypothetical protein
MYLAGRGVPVDAREALKLYRKAAKHDYAPAEFDLGMMYLRGTGVPRDPDEAMKWLHRAAAHGSPAAENRLALAYQAGEGVPRNYEMAAKWYGIAAEHGLAEARHRLDALRSLVRNDPQASAAPMPQSFLDSASAAEPELSNAAPR